jgi:hypothetical protein
VSNTSKTKSTLLLIEDADLVAMTMSMTLEDMGYDVEHYIGVKRAPGGGLIGFRQDWTEEVIDLGRLPIAFVDGQLPGDSLQGPEIIPVLIEAKVVPIVTSGHLDSVRLMKEAGAKHALSKLSFRKEASAALAEIELSLA